MNDNELKCPYCGAVHKYSFEDIRDWNYNYFDCYSCQKRIKTMVSIIIEFDEPEKATCDSFEDHDFWMTSEPIDNIFTKTCQICWYEHIFKKYLDIK